MANTATGQGPSGGKADVAITAVSRHPCWAAIAAVATDPDPGGALPALSHIEAFCAVLPPSGLRVLDVGAGQGAFVAALNAAGARACGVEIDAGRAAAASRDSGADIRHGRAEQLPFADGSFDALTFMFSLHHVPHPLHARAMEEAARVLRPGGALYIAEPEIDSDMTRIVAVIDDETEVRQAALATLAGLPDTHPFMPVAQRRYTLRRRFASFDALVARLITVDPARAARLAPRRDAMQARFERHSTPTAEGHSIDQHVTARHFVKKPPDIPPKSL